MRSALFELPVDETKTLIIPDASWANDIFQLIYRDREHLREWLPWVDQVRRVADTKNNLNARIVGFKKKTDASFYGLYKGEIAASVGFISLGDGEGEIGYWLLSDYQGFGLMTDYVRACIAYGFGELELEQITIKCVAENVKSAAIPQRLGFKQKPALGRELDGQDDAMETFIYTLSKQDWHP